LLEENKGVWEPERLRPLRNPSPWLYFVTLISGTNEAIIGRERIRP